VNSPGRLRIAETFASVQGEGWFIGCPSWFIRVSGCTMRCRWCDTPYASWDPEGPVREVSDVLVEALGTGISHVVVTGGEPMAFPQIDALVAGLEEAGRVVTIETAGVHFRDVSCSLMSLSPKLAHSAPDPLLHPEWHRRHEDLRTSLDALTRLATSYFCQLKIVVNPESEADWGSEVERIVSACPSIPPERIFMMAEGVQADVLHRRERLLAGWCIQKGWRISPRFHIDLYGDTRGT
jgi:7-carboxy-7-deazaguanine synthase